jgi:hypothetical protein
MLRGKEKVMDWFGMCKDSKHTVWKLVWARNLNKTILSLAGDGDNEDEGDNQKKGNLLQALKISFEDSRKRLDDILSILDPGDYILMCANRPQWGKGQIEVQFTIPGEQRTAANGTQAGGIGYSQQQVDRMIVSEIAKLRAEIRLEQIEKELKILQGSSGDKRFDKFIDAVQPHIGTIVESMTGTPAKTAVAVSGFTKGKGDTKDEQAKLEETLERLNKVRPNDILEILEIVTKTAENDPKIIEMFKLQYNLGEKK